MSPPIYTPDGSEVSEIVLPDGSTASEVIGPDGNVVFEAGGDIPDSELYYPINEGSGTTWTDTVGNTDASFGSGSYISSSDYVGGYYFETSSYAEIDGFPHLEFTNDWSVGFTVANSESEGTLLNRVGASNNHRFAVGIDSGNVGLFTGGNTVVEAFTSEPTPPYRVFVTWDASTEVYECYINASQATGTGSVNTGQVDDRLTINGRSDGSYNVTNAGFDAMEMSNELVDPQVDYDNQPWS